MEIKQRLIPIKYTSIRPRIKLVPKYITVHETANTSRGADAAAHASLLERGNSRTASWHFSIDDKQIIQHIPENEVSWHAGDGRNGTGNRQSLSLEICVNQDGNYEKAKQNAIWLIQYLMKKHNIPVGQVVPHKKWSGKDCPHKLLPHWNEFINKIKGSVTLAEIVDDMYDLSYLKDYRLIGLRSTKQPREIHDKITWAMEARANCVLLTKRGYDLRLLQKALNRMYPSE